MNGTGQKIIELQGVSKAFGAHEVLPPLRLDIYHGEFITLLGPSGCGKTTLLRLIGGFEQPDAGRILLAGATSPICRPTSARSIPCSRAMRCSRT